MSESFVGLPKPVYSPTPPDRKKWIGAPMNRREDPPLITGTGLFTDDVNLPGMLYAAFVRSPYAHARIKSIDVSEALKVPGVITSATGEELAREIKPFFSRRRLYQEDLASLGATPNVNNKPVNDYGLAVGKAKFAGHAIAVVVATDRYTAVDAAEKVVVEYETLPVVVDPEKALEKGAPLVNEEYGQNIAAEFKVEGGDVEKAFAQADKVFSYRFREHRHANCSMEPRAVVATYSPFSEEMTVWGSFQAADLIRPIIANALGIAESRLRIINRFIGGSYGEKTRIREEFVICYLAKKLAKPVKWSATRTEHMLTSGHARDEIWYVDAAVTNQGKFVGVKVKQLVDTGFGIAVPSLMTAGFYFPGPYKLENYKCEITSVTTNKTYFAGYRGLIKIDAVWAMDRTIELLAKDLNMPSSEIKMKNFVKPEEFPYRMVTGAIYDGGNYPEALRRVMENIDVQKIKAEQKKLREQGRYIGLGLSLVLEPTGAGRPSMPATDSSTIRVEPSGSVLVLQGLSSNSGQGHQTSLSQIVADELGVSPDIITVPEGDTAAVKAGSAYSSRFSVVSTSAATLAARSLRKKIIDIVSFLMKIPPEKLDMKDGLIFVKSDPKKSMTLRQVAHQVYNFHYRLPPGTKPILEATEWFESPNIVYKEDEKGRTGFFAAFPYAACAAVVEVDVETGAVKVNRFLMVHDCGTIINPAILETQDQGAFTQGIGGALYEHLVYDENGQLLNPTLVDYIIPRFDEAPVLESDPMVTPSLYTILGSKGGGETTLIGGFVTLAAAVEDAIEPFGGGRVTSSILSPEYVLGLIKAGKQKGK